MEPDYKKILLNLIGSLTLCDHMGDVSEDIQEALEQAGIKLPEDDTENCFHFWRRELHKLGVTTLVETELWDEDDEADETEEE